MAYYKKVKVVRFQKCAECGRRFELNSNRIRVYCSHKCGSRVASRECMRRKRMA